MINLSLESLAEILGSTSQGLSDTRFNAVTIDSRNSCSGQLFVALKGDNFDGHRFVEAAYKNGAVAALVETQQDCEIPQILVPDCRVAMGRLANYWRHVCAPCVLSLTGSNGKTTVKEMLYQILVKQASTHATRGNFNNDIGVPLTLFELNQQHDYAIIELGANHRGEIARLAGISEPDIVYVNNVAAAHLAGFGDVQGVIEAKGELYAYCRPEHKALFNNDEVASQYWRSICAAGTQIGCALNNEADAKAKWHAIDGGLQVTFSFQGEQASCDINVLGEHNARNALAAVSMACLAGIELSHAVSSLNGFTGIKGRLQLMQGPDHSRLINDSYNANPDSLEAGIKVLCSLKGEAWLALGDMGELGDDALELHRKAAQSAQSQGVEKMFGLGQMSCAASEAFGDSGICFETIDDMANSIRSQIHHGVNLLIKGSRAARMERLVELLTQSINEGNANAI
jgi:UDP-N-acetylmuramoyl-tripeptide--D-alanyl-D-alanine ligase